MKIKSLSALSVIVVLTSCSPQYTYFTKSLYEKEHWTKDDISRIQFYVSRDITLSRAVSDDETSITEGKIRIINGKKVQQVVIRQGTPGVVVLMPKEDRFAISFEEADNDAFLMFGPNPKYDNRFALLAQDWERENGKIHYKGQVYNVDSGSAYSSLMVDLKRIGENQYETKHIQGRKVPG